MIKLNYFFRLQNQILNKITYSQKYKKLIFSFNANNKNPDDKQNVKQQINKNQFNNNLVEQQEQEKENKTQQYKNYIYDKRGLETINDKQFIEKIRKLEQSKNNNQKWSLDGLKFPLLLIGTALFIYHCWDTIPYSVVYRHASISEYIPREYYIHAIFAGALSFQSVIHLLTYLPLMIMGIYFCGQFMKQRHMFYLFFSNAILTYLVTFFLERNRHNKMITPKVHGGVTALTFITTAFALNPRQLLLGSQFLPFFVIPAIFTIYEIYEYQHSYLNDKCREAHLISIMWGLLFGLAFRRLRLIRKF